MAGNHDVELIDNSLSYNQMAIRSCSSFHSQKLGTRLRKDFVHLQITFADVVGHLRRKKEFSTLFANIVSGSKRTSSIWHTMSWYRSRRGLVSRVLTQGLDVRPQFKPQGRHIQLSVMHKVFLWRLPLSRCLAKTLRVKTKIAMKSFSKICRLKSTLNCSSQCK